jgi:glycosyltransferase involved in cell wall biosynthesis
VLRAAVDATPLLGTRTGVGVAVDGFLRNLAARGDVEVTGYGLTLRGAAALAGQLPAGVRAAARPLPAGVLLRVWAHLDRPTSRWWAGRADVVHGTNYVVPPTAGAAAVMSVWDLSPVRYPQLCTPIARRYPALVARALTRGAWVHTAAASVAAEVVEHFGADPARVRVVAPALDLPGRPDAGASAPARSGPPYVLALGRAEPRKDFPGLVRAFDQVAAGHPDLQLWLAGPAGWGEDELKAAIDAARHRDRIRRLGWVEDRLALLAGAEVFAYPSRYEGFGLPPLEAMAAGVPVVATAAGAVPEVVGDAAVLVPAGDVDALAGALARVVGDAALAGRLRRAGQERVGRYRGEAAAAGLVALYRDALDST